jgi:GntR family carbon starvation induced transcriptional regulator
MGKIHIEHGLSAASSDAVAKPGKADRLSGMTRTRSAYHLLRERVVSGDLGPGTKLNIAQLAAELDVSPGAIREALAMLEVDAFVASEPQRGYTVMPLSASDMEMLTHARIEIERLCLAESLALGSIEWESAVVGAFHRLSRLEEQVDKVGRMSPEWTDAHREFHRVLASACRNRWLLKMREVLYQQSERYRQFSAPWGKATREVESEHRELMSAALAHDEARMGRLISEHLSRTAEIVVEGLRRRASPP